MKKLMKKTLKFSIVTAVIGVIAGYFAASMMFDSYDVTTKKLILNQMSESQFYIVIALQTGLLYGGIIEEVLCRFFLMSLISFILWKLFSRKSTK